MQKSPEQKQYDRDMKTWLKDEKYNLYGKIKR